MIPEPLPRKQCGYTIIEAMVAISLLMLAVGAAASLSMTMVNQEELNARAARALNWQENAVRLYQLGLGLGNDTSDLLAVMPGLPGLNTFTASTNAVTFAALPSGNAAVDVTDLTLRYTSHVETGTERTSVMTVVRY